MALTEDMRPDRILVIDLDGTLIRSDMLFETFWSAFSARWTAPFVVTKSLLNGRAALKHRLNELAQVDPASLPYNDEVLDYIRRWKDEGGRTALVTATNQAIADRVADHIGLFDEVHGSDQSHNLKGPNKATFLEQRFGVGGFEYMGDSTADVPVWQKSGKAITVNAPGALRTRVDAMMNEVEHISAAAPSVRPYFKALRPHQWLKNLLVFLPMLMAHDFTGAMVLRSFLAFLAFSLVASSVYVLNDLLDLAADRAHPRKRFRPFASGSLPIANGTWLAPLLLLGGFGLALLLGPSFMLVMAVYYVTTTAYSLYLKRQLVIDICTLAVLYALRIIAGGAATGIELSVWLLAFSVFFFFSLAAVKRQAELVDSASRGKASADGRGYQTSDLPLISTMAAAAGYVSVLVMALYVNSSSVTALYTSPTYLWGICLVLLYWISRIVMITHRGAMHDDPVVFAVKDRVSQICLVIIFLISATGAMS
ncbi:UbiA family prenyltransferase [Actibacterium lipolyticum]|uniref:Decaprenyl-phosphate phosphoribosyltransferase n=1 Tax=Actibacterium lipolyticum TaxID=1524263 RepID=A0A238KQ55_9RHOB|nr:UbiA family prenyltransferase [Actibacterium lipolyticum]SMX44156.1 Decaprenyl-phosphate phosphoribosyltransferase [Actibacterium lipolyticum]